MSIEVFTNSAELVPIYDYIFAIKCTFMTKKKRLCRFCLKGLVFSFSLFGRVTIRQKPLISVCDKRGFSTKCCIIVLIQKPDASFFLFTDDEIAVKGVGASGIDTGDQRE